MTQYFAAAFSRLEGGWTGEELDLDDVDDLDTVVDLLRDLAAEDDEATGTVVLFLEEEDEYLAVVRVDGDNDPRIFLSDARAATDSDIISVVAEEAEVTPIPGGDVEEEAATVVDDVDEDDEDEEDEERAGGNAPGDPAGDAGVLADLGTAGPDLLALCAEEGMLPSDIIQVLCERAGCADVLEELRGA